MTTETVQNLARLRLLVGVLGQKNHASWWDCSFLTDAGLESLDYNFPRAPFSAAFSATIQAAKRLHDERIGRTGVTHLFRLESELEMMVHRSAAGEGLEALKSTSLERESLMRELAGLGGSEIDSPEGPVQVGDLSHASTDRGLAQLARHYHAGFRLGLRVLPYFASKRP